jgi:hypothetical protein
MHGAPIYFQFSEKNAAYQALDTLMELGYHVHMLENGASGGKPTLQVIVEKGDLTSALEIAQAHGGTVLEEVDSPQEAALYSSAYDLDDGSLMPAHVVTEDLSESYMNGSADMPYGGDGEAERDGPSSEDYDHFPAGIRL